MFSESAEGTAVVVDFDSVLIFAFALEIYFDKFTKIQLKSYYSTTRSRMNGIKYECFFLNSLILVLYSILNKTFDSVWVFNSVSIHSFSGFESAVIPHPAKSVAC